MMRRNRIIAFLLVLTMVISICPLSAFAASNTYQLAVANAVTVDGTADQTVDVYFQTINANSTYSLEATWSTSETEATNYISLSSLTAGSGASPMENDATTGKVYWTDTTFNDPVTTEAGGTVWTATYTVNKDTPTGTYTVGLSGMATPNTYTTENFGTLTATIKVTNNAGTVDPSTGYTASITSDSTNPTTVRVGDTIKVDLGSNAAFSAMKMVVTYPSNLVEFDATNSSVGTATVNSATAGTLDMADYGADKTAGTSNYVLAFKAFADGTASFALTEAKFGTGTSAIDASLTDATLPSALSITIEKAQHSVSLPGIFAGATSVDNGGTYTFTPEIATGAYYEYALPTATMNGQTVAVTATDNGWQIANVTGDLVITGTREEKNYNVTWEGNGVNDITSKPATIPYGTDYTVTLPADKDASTEDGYTYSISATKNGTSVGSYDSTTRVFTIAGTDITDAITITVTKTTVSANQVTITISGSTDVGFDGETGTSITVNKGANVTLVLTPETGYAYSVTVGDATTPVTFTDNKYTFTANETVTVTVTKTVDITTNASVSQYVQADGSVFWLVKIAPTNPGTQITGKTYTYGGSNMYWSSAYNAYATLVVAETQPTLTVDEFAIVGVDTIPAITYDMNVNMTTDNVVDPADAQLVWNMYQPLYNDFTEKVTMGKFLKADVNGDSIISTLDAQSIIKSVLKITDTTT